VVSTRGSIVDPPQFPAQDCHLMRSKNVDYQGNLCTIPSEFVTSSESVAFKLRWEHGFHRIGSKKF
jgi:hypothetical protein